MNSDQEVAVESEYNSVRRKRSRRKRKSALFTSKKKRTTTSNIRVPKAQRLKLYRERCKQKKLLKAQGRLENGKVPPVNYEKLEANYPVFEDESKANKKDANNRGNT